MVWYEVRLCASKADTLLARPNDACPRSEQVADDDMYMMRQFAFIFANDIIVQVLQKLFFSRVPFATFIFVLGSFGVKEQTSAPSFPRIGNPWILGRLLLSTVD